MIDKRRACFNFGLAVLLILIVIFIFRQFRPVPETIKVKRIARVILPVRTEDKEAGIYDIDRYRTRHGRVSKKPPVNLREVYENFPAEDAGDDMITGWSKVGEADKAKFIEGLDREISKAKQALSDKPDDKKARAILAISESMKKLCLDNFNYSPTGALVKKRDDRSTQNN